MPDCFLPDAILKKFVSKFHSSLDSLLREYHTVPSAVPFFEAELDCENLAMNVRSYRADREATRLSRIGIYEPAFLESRIALDVALLDEPGFPEWVASRLLSSYAAKVPSTGLPRSTSQEPDHAPHPTD